MAASTSVMTILIPAFLLDQMLAYATDSPHEEVCGLLWGREGGITAIEPTRNVAPDPSCWFEIDPQPLIAALRRTRQGGDTVVGYYHSHPNGSAEPSARDLAAAEPGKLWLIVGGGVARLWLAKAKSFKEIQLIAT